VGVKGRGPGGRKVEDVCELSKGSEEFRRVGGGMNQAITWGLHTIWGVCSGKRQGGGNGWGVICAEDRRSRVSGGGESRRQTLPPVDRRGNLCLIEKFRWLEVASPHSEAL